MWFDSKQNYILYNIALNYVVCRQSSKQPRALTFFGNKVII